MNHFEQETGLDIQEGREEPGLKASPTQVGAADFPPAQPPRYPQSAQYSAPMAAFTFTSSFGP